MLSVVLFVVGSIGVGGAGDVGVLVVVSVGVLLLVLVVGAVGVAVLAVLGVLVLVVVALRKPPPTPSAGAAFYGRCLMIVSFRCFFLPSEVLTSYRDYAGLRTP